MAIMVAILISDQNDLNKFYLQISKILPTKIRVNWSFFQEKKFEIDYQDGGYLEFPIVTILASFKLQGCSDTSYQVSSRLAVLFRLSSK